MVRTVVIDTWMWDECGIASVLNGFHSWKVPMGTKALGGLAASPKHSYASIIRSYCIRAAKNEVLDADTELAGW